ncbi:sulfotransferase 1A1-like [Haliotis rufescens]|uniref:sulfotransferase 1A1-like n=1 Tax=Haliotis rufescens TaxID=6454 RepID=UPI001EAFBC11|nr:sulfotransferase 1A1-like [Haliotis rufescens]
MTSVTVADAGGDEMTLSNHNGYIYPDFPCKKAVLNMPAVKVRSDDVLVCAYPKSGTNWVWEKTRLLLAGKLDCDDVSKMTRMLEFRDEGDYKDLPSPRILNSHQLFRQLPVDVSINKPKIIYLIRNPKDLAVSYYNFAISMPHFKYNGQWTNYLKSLMEGKFDYGSWFDYVKDWEEVKKTTDVPILTIYYENLKQDTFRETKRLCEFLGVERSEAFVTQVCNQCEFDSLKKLKATSKVTRDSVYRKGQIGDWKNWFTVAQNEWFDMLYAEKMGDCHLDIKYSSK